MITHNLICKPFFFPYEEFRLSIFNDKVYFILKSINFRFVILTNFRTNKCSRNISTLFNLVQLFNKIRHFELNFTFVRVRMLITVCYSLMRIDLTCNMFCELTLVLCNSLCRFFNTLWDICILIFLSNQFLFILLKRTIKLRNSTIFKVALMYLFITNCLCSFLL